MENDNIDIKYHEEYGFDVFLEDVKKQINLRSYRLLNEEYNSHIVNDNLAWNEICELYDTWKFQLKYAFPSWQTSYDALYEFLTTTSPDVFAYRMSVIPAFLKYEIDNPVYITMIFDRKYVVSEDKIVFDALYEKEIKNSAIACCYTENDRYINPYNNREICIEFTQNYTKEVTDKVYRFFKNHRFDPSGAIVWHICPKYVYENKIKKTGLLPKAKRKYNRNYLSRIYVFLNKPDDKKLKFYASDLNKAIPEDKGWDKQSNEWMLLKINLKLAGEPLRFFEDPEYPLAGVAAFTYESIHPRCISIEKEFSIN